MFRVFCLFIVVVKVYDAVALHNCKFVSFYANACIQLIVDT